MSDHGGFLQVLTQCLYLNTDVKIIEQHRHTSVFFSNLDSVKNNTSLNKAQLAP